MKKPLRFIAVFIALALGIYIWKTSLSTAPSMKRLDAEFSLKTTELYEAFERDEEAANAQYLNKVIELEGSVASIETSEQSKPVINLSTEGFGLVKCTLESDLSEEEKKRLEVNSIIRVKGECIGYLLDVLVERTIILK